MKVVVVFNIKFKLFIQRLIGTINKVQSNFIKLTENSNLNIIVVLKRDMLLIYIPPSCEMWAKFVRVIVGESVYICTVHTME